MALIDDHQATLDALGDLLDALQIASIAFTSAEAFLEHPRRPQVTCLILDVNLAGMSGLDLKATLNRRGDSTPVIFLTSMDDAATRARAIELGAASLLVKPAEGSTLVEWLDKLA